MPRNVEKHNYTSINSKTHLKVFDGGMFGCCKILVQSWPPGDHVLNHCLISPELKIRVGPYTTLTLIIGVPGLKCRSCVESTQG